MFIVYILYVFVYILYVFICFVYVIRITSVGNGVFLENLQVKGGHSLPVIFTLLQHIMKDI